MMIAIKNGIVMTMADAGIVENGTILVEGSKIEAIGKNVKIPDGTEEIDVTGKTVLPGLIDSHNHIGGHAEAEDPPFDNNEWTSPVTPYVRMIDGVNPQDEGFDTALRGGVTAIFCTPGSANVISGTASVLKTYGHTIDDMIVKDPAAMKMAFGRKWPRPSADIPYPQTRMGTAAILRNALVKTRTYMRKMEAAEKDPEKDPPDPDIGLEYLSMVLRKEIPAHIHMSRADDLMTVARIADEFDFHWCIAHGFDALTVADELARRNIGVSLGPFIYSDRAADFKWTPDVAAKLHKAGVKVAMQTDGPAVSPTQHLILSAAAAARAGMDEWEALKSVTINAAEINWVAHRLGSLEPGKDADLVVYSGHPLKWRTKVERVFVNGKEVVTNV